jgi:hypothetical protein
VQSSSASVAAHFEALKRDLLSAAQGLRSSPVRIAQRPGRSRKVHVGSGATAWRGALHALLCFCGAGPQTGPLIARQPRPITGLRGPHAPNDARPAQPQSTRAARSTGRCTTPRTDSGSGRSLRSLADGMWTNTTVMTFRRSPTAIHAPDAAHSRDRFECFLPWRLLREEVLCRVGEAPSPGPVHDPESSTDPRHPRAPDEPYLIRSGVPTGVSR